MSTNRRLVCEAAFGYTPFLTIPAGDWIELLENGRPRIKEVTWSFGRDDELEHFQPGTATILLSNRDRRLDPDNTASPHFGFLLPNVPVRIRSKNEDTGTYEDEFYGFVVSGWEQVLAPTRTGDCRIELVDYLGVLSGYRLNDVFHQALLDEDPVGMWILDGSSVNASDAERVTDLGSAKRDGTIQGEGVALGDKIITPGAQPAAQFTVGVDSTTNQETFGSVYMGKSPIVTGDMADPMVVATFLARTVADGDRRVIFAQNNANEVSTGIQLSIGAADQLFYTYLNNATESTGGGGAYVWAPGVMNIKGLYEGRGHIAFASGSGISIDTATLRTSPIATGAKISRINGAGIGGGHGVEPQDHMDGWIGVVALYAADVDLTGRGTIITALGRLAGQRSDQHIAWALDQIGVPAGLRNLAAGTVMLGPADTRDRDALEWIREVTATEGGAFYVDHRDGGKLRFTDRYHRYLAARSTASQATFTDDPNTSATVNIRYTAEGLDVASNGLDGIVNQVTATWASGSVTVQDDTSIAAYGPRSRQVDTVATTDSHARSVAEWLVSRYKDPRSRIRGCVASARSTFQRHDEVEDLEIHDRVTFRVRPLHTGTATTATLYVDGVSHAASRTEWATSFRFAPAETFTPWVWGTSEWDNETYWG